ncbi:MAG: hypothetical protein JW724_03280, partial [Candidatus Altiarchaeota archaeon]|nr:hypothetical protein [Candidatus Altiarchaeota archaeon]
MAGVLSISQHGCIRVVKQGVALHNSGVPVEFLAERFANKEYAKVLAPLTTLYASQEAFDHYVRQSEASLFHIHNEPDWIVHRAKALRPDVPIVYDCHDLNCMRIGEAMEDEVLAMKAADAYIFPSHAYMEGAVKYHNIPDSKPRAVVYSMCSSGMLVDGVQMPHTGGIAYEGGLALCLPGADENARKLTAHRDYRPIAEALTGMGIPFTVYSGNNQFMYEYMIAGTVYISTLPHAFMLRELTRHDWGLVGCPVPHPQWDTAMPN